jgi:hypothetical protein
MNLNPPHITLGAGTAGVIAIGVACLDAWVFHGFGQEWDKGLIEVGLSMIGAGVTYAAGLKTPSPHE